MRKAGLPPQVKVGNNETTSIHLDSLLGEFTVSSESQINETSLRPESVCIHNFRHKEQSTLRPGDGVCDTARSLEYSLAYPTLARLREFAEKRVWLQSR